MDDSVYGNIDPIQSFDFDNDGLYANTETITTTTQDDKKQEGEKSAGDDSREIKCYTVAVVSLGLLCVLLLAIIISVAIKGNAERNQLRNEIELQQFIYNNLTQEKDQLQATISHVKKLCDLKSFGSSLYYISSDKRNWADSKQDCIDRGAHLVITDSKEEQEFIFSQGKTAWIGLSDLETEGVWKWVDGKDLGKLRFWMKGEPNDHHGAENCVEIIASGQRFTSWNDMRCGSTKHYICEM